MIAHRSAMKALGALSTGCPFNAAHQPFALARVATKGLRALRAGLPGTFAAHLTVARLATRAFGH